MATNVRFDPPTSTIDQQRVQKYHELTGKFETLLFQLTTDGPERRQIALDMDETLEQLKTQFLPILDRQRPLDYLLVCIFEKGEDKDAAYRGYMLTNLIENHKVASECNHLFRAVAFLIYGNTKDADVLIRKHNLRFKAEQFPNPSGNETMFSNLRMVIQRAQQIGR